jgi:hypothetical protein
MSAKITKGNTDKFNTRIRSLFGFYIYIPDRKGCQDMEFVIFMDVITSPFNNTATEAAYISTTMMQCLKTSLIVACIQCMGFKS